MHQNKKYQFSNRKICHSIPISCAFALLLLGISCLNPVGSASQSTYAAENPEAGSTWIAVNPVISMSIMSPTDSSTTNNSAEAETGTTSYISNLVKVSIRGLDGYTLQLTAADGASTTLNNGSTIISGATGQTGTNLAVNTWGYGWGAENAAEANLNYYALPAYGATGTNNTNGLLESNSNISTDNTNMAYIKYVDFTKKLTFAAKFDSSAEAGHYKTSALLSLVASPQTQVTIYPFGNITKMQDMTSNICKNTIDSSGTLLDTRDNRTYNVRKLKDGNCWMVENLKLSNVTISSYDSDMRESDGDFTVPASNISGFTSSDQYDPKAYVDSTYGGYYNWYTATAGTGDASFTSGNAPSSICPKGWQLPVNGDSNTDKSYTKLLSGLTTGSALTANPYIFVYGGQIDSNNLSGTGDNGAGFYWSSTANGTAKAYFLRFTSTSVIPSYSSQHHLGRSVRCVAK